MFISALLFAGGDLFLRQVEQEEEGERDGVGWGSGVK